MSKIFIDEALAQPHQQTCKDGSCDCCWKEPAQQEEPAGLLQEIARLHDRIKDLEKDVVLPAQQCKWPTCQREDYQQALAEQIKRELVGEQPAQQEQTMYLKSSGPTYGPAPEQKLIIKYVNESEQPAQQEPVACVQDLDEVKRKHLVYEKGMDWKDSLYTSPPQRKPLTDEEIYMNCPAWLSQDQCKTWVRQIEAAHGIKE